MKSYVKSGDAKGFVKAVIVVVIAGALLMGVAGLVPVLRAISDNINRGLSVANNGFGVVIDAGDAAVDLGNNIVGGFKSGL